MAVKPNKTKQATITKAAIHELCEEGNQHTPPSQEPRNNLSRTGNKTHRIGAIATRRNCSTLPWCWLEPLRNPSIGPLGSLRGGQRDSIGLVPFKPHLAWVFLFQEIYMFEKLTAWVIQQPVFEETPGLSLIRCLKKQQPSTFKFWEPQCGRDQQNNISSSGIIVCWSGLMAAKKKVFEICSQKIPQQWWSRQLCLCLCTRQDRSRHLRRCAHGQTSVQLSFWER